MDRRTAIVLSVVLPSIWAVLMYPCAEPPKPERAHYVTGAWVGWNETDQPSSLPDQLLRNPCLEVEYYGHDIKRSVSYSIYGTCNYREMFRYTARVLIPHGCWRTELEYRPDPNGPCERYSINRTITIAWGNLTMVAHLNSERTQTATLMDLSAYHHILTKFRSIATSSPGRDHQQYNDARVQRCRCNSTSRPRQSEFWHRGQHRRRCARPSEKPEEIQATLPNDFIIGWLVLALVMVGVTGTVGAVLYSRV